jgi:inhibitor of KinA sporulation pathway (predicted exonuclease)
MQYPTTKRVQRDTLGEILKDKTYLPHDSSSYRGFIADMKTAVDTGRYITPKMFTAINKIIKTYHDWKDPSKLVQKRTDQERIFRKLNQLRSRLKTANYSAGYAEQTELFINSIEQQATWRFSITDGQMVALNRMYKKFNHRIKEISR